MLAAGPARRNLLQKWRKLGIKKASKACCGAPFFEKTLGYTRPLLTLNQAICCPTEAEATLQSETGYSAAMNWGATASSTFSLIVMSGVIQTTAMKGTGYHLRFPMALSTGFPSSAHKQKTFQICWVLGFHSQKRNFQVWSWGALVRWWFAALLQSDGRFFAVILLVSSAFEADLSAASTLVTILQTASRSA